MEMPKQLPNGRTEGLVSKAQDTARELRRFEQTSSPATSQTRSGTWWYASLQASIGFSTPVMAGTSIDVIKKSIGHGGTEMVVAYTHLLISCRANLIRCV